MQYTVKTFNGAELIKSYSKNGELSPIRYKNSLIKSTEQTSLTPLFYQIALEKGTDKPQCDSFEKILIFVDFGSVNNFGNNECTEKLFGKGFNIDYGEGNIIKYVPFEKSASQSRNKIMGFIDAELFYGLKKRLNLEINFNDIFIPTEHTKDYQISTTGVQLSKLYAYRGLYLSDVYIPEDVFENDSLFSSVRNLLNEKTVVVIKDKVSDYSLKNNKSPLSVSDVVFYKKDNIIDDQFVLEKLEDEKENPEIKKNHFDGVGIISKEAAYLLNRFLKNDPKYSPKDLKECENTSFQCRMPFVKGMLHAVDFKSYFRQIMGVENYENAFVTDVFGFERKLSEVEIVLTESMFKLLSLIKTYPFITCINSEANSMDRKDPMEYYFEMFKKYQHNLYITKTDKTYKHNGYVRLSAQILNTLNLSNAAFEEMIKNHMAVASDPVAFMATNSEKSCIAPWQDFLFKSKRIVTDENGTQKTGYIALFDKYIKRQIESLKTSVIDDIASGNLLVKGDIRILCPDLLCFLRHIYYGCIIKEKSPQENDTIARGKIFIPDYNSVNGTPVTLFRSPHLSNNENCICTVFGKNEDSSIDAKDNSCFNNYMELFGHLDVAMIGLTSFMDCALGGADYDGDIIDVVYDETVFAACINNSYTENKKIKSKSLPFVSIPSLGSKDEGRTHINPTDNYIRFEIVKNTFNNYVGQISNAALKIFCTENCMPEYSRVHAYDCVAVTGLEIDSAKTGVVPNKLRYLEYGKTVKNSDNDTAKSIVKEIESFIERKNIASDFASSYLNKIEHTTDNKSGKITYNVKISDKIYTLSLNEDYPTITKLHYYWAKERSADKGLCYPKISNGRKEIVALFNDVNGSGAESASKDPIIAEMYDAYLDVLSVYKEDKKILSDALNQNKGRIHTLLKERNRDISDELLDDFECLFLTKSADDLEKIAGEYFSETKNDNFWAFAEKDARENIIAQILFTEKTNIDSEMQNIIESFSDFYMQGYFLLYYAVADAQKILKENQLYNRKAKKDDSITDIYYKAFRKNLTKKSWQQEITQKCIETIKHRGFGICDIYPAAVFTNDSERGNAYELFWNMVRLNGEGKLEVKEGVR